MTQAAPRHPARVAVLIVLVLALAAGFVWAARRQVAAPPADGVVVVREGASPLLQKGNLAPAAAPTSAVAQAAREPSAPDAKIVRALGMPAGASLSDLAPGNAAAQAICGWIAPAPDAPVRRFVFLGLAGLGAVDDGGAEFAQLRERMCARSR